MKKIGFIRWKGFIPFVIITAAVYIFATFYLDSILKKALVKNGTHLNGALVEVSSLKVSFINSSLKIKGVQVTNPNNLMQNRFEIDNILLDFRFLPLLKKKFVTDEINVTGVKWLTPRKTEGKIPVAWQKEWEKDKDKPSDFASFVSEAVANLTNTIKAELPDISVDSLKEKFDPRKAIKVEELASYKKAFEMKDKAVGTYDRWNKDTAKIVDDQKRFISDMKNKILSLNPKKMNNPQAIISALDTVQTFDKDIKSEKNLLTGKIKDATTDVKTLAREVKSVPDLIKQDVKGIVARYSFGNLGIENISKQIFGLTWVPYFQKYVYYRAKALAYVNKYKASKKDEKKAERFKGVDIEFPITDGIPKFLISKVHLSADTGEKEKQNEFYRGKYELLAESITSNQKLLGKPTTADLTLETYEGPFRDAALNLLLDYREEPEKDDLKLSVHKFKLSDFTLGKNSALPIPLKSAFANASLAGGTVGDKVKIGITLDFNNAVYSFSKSTNYLVSLFQDIVSTIDNFKVGIDFFGTLKEPKFTISSTLDNAIAKGIKKVFEAKLAEVKAKAEKYIQEEVGKYLNEANTKVASLENDVKNKLGDQLKSVDGISGEAKKKIDELKNRQKELLGQKLNIPKGIF